MNFWPSFPFWKLANPTKLLFVYHKIFHFSIGWVHSRDFHSGPANFDQRYGNIANTEVRSPDEDMTETYDLEICLFSGDGQMTSLFPRSRPSGCRACDIYTVRFYFWHVTIAGTRHLSSDQTSTTYRKVASLEKMFWEQRQRPSLYARPVLSFGTPLSFWTASE